jgi:hypothetical protein
LCLYFALAREGKLDAGRPRVWLAEKKCHSWAELFPLDVETQVWMCRNLVEVLDGSGVHVVGEQRQTYLGLRPDVWIQDGRHAIIVENKTARGRQQRQEREYLAFLHEAAFQGLTRAFLYSVPQGWLPNWQEAEWWHFVRERDASDEVLRGIIAWDDEFVELLSERLGVPQWFRDKLPNRVDEGKFLDPGQTFSQAWGIDLDTKHRLR